LKVQMAAPRRAGGSRRVQSAERRAGGRGRVEGVIGALLRGAATRRGRSRATHPKGEVALPFLYLFFTEFRLDWLQWMRNGPRSSRKRVFSCQRASSEAPRQRSPLRPPDNPATPYGTPPRSARSMCRYILFYTTRRAG
jgi:hypothetical protein